MVAHTCLVLVSGLDSRGLVGSWALFIGRGLQYGREITSPQCEHSMCGPSKPQALGRLKASCRLSLGTTRLATRSLVMTACFTSLSLQAVTMNIAMNSRVGFKLENGCASERKYIQVKAKSKGLGGGRI